MGICSLLLISVLAQSASIPTGSALDARLESDVHTAASAAGERVTAAMTNPVHGSGKVLIPKGTKLIGRIETIQHATQTSEGRVRLVFREMQFPNGQNVQTWITSSFDASPPGRGARYAVLIGGGGAAGGLIGGKGARLAGILGGALIGFILGESWGGSKLPDLTLRSGKILHLRLGEDLTIPK
jgi:hypothetical protein